MDYEELPLIDRMGGGIARKGLAGVRRITGRLVRRRTTRVVRARGAGGLPAHPRNVLVVKLWGLGHMAHAGRALTSLRRGHPNARIALLSTPECLGVYGANDLYDEAIPFDPVDARGVSAAVAALRPRLRERPVDLAVNLDGLSELAALLAAESQPQAAVGFVSRERSRGAYTRAIRWRREAHVADLLYEAARAAGGARVEPGPVRPVVRGQERAWAAQVLRDAQVDPHTYLVGLHVGAGAFYLGRAWPPEKFALLAQWIEEQAEYRAAFLGGDEDVRATDRALAHMSQPALHLTGGVDVRGTLALLERMHLFVGSDAGPLHLAEVLDVPTVGLYGPESPARVGRRDNEERHAAVYRICDRSPCVSLLAVERPVCELGNRCVLDLSVEAVRAVVSDMLDHLSDPENPPWLARESG